MNQDINASELVEQHADYLLAFALTKINDRDLAKDFVQDTFLSALKHLDTFEGKSSIRTWLTSILNRKIIDYWRKAETRYTDPVSSFFNSEGNGSWILEKKPSGRLAEFEEEYMQAETHDELLDCIEKLPKNWSDILTTKYFEEKKGDEICKDFNITSSNLWVIIHRAKLLLRECLENKWTI